MVARDTDDYVNILRQKRIHTAIIDVDWQTGTLAVIKIIRMDYPMIPCILLTSHAGQPILSKALQLDVFGVVDKPVNMDILRQVLERLFIKKYNSDIFAEKRSIKKVKK